MKVNYVCFTWRPSNKHNTLRFISAFEIHKIQVATFLFQTDQQSQFTNELDLKRLNQDANLISVRTNQLYCTLHSSWQVEKSQELN